MGKGFRGTTSPTLACTYIYHKNERVNHSIGNLPGPEPRDFEWSGHSWNAVEVIVMHTSLIMIFKSEIVHFHVIVNCIC